jgi:hypothetical protein
MVRMPQIDPPSEYLEQLGKTTSESVDGHVTRADVAVDDRSRATDHGSPLRDLSPKVKGQLIMLVSLAISVAVVMLALFLYDQFVRGGRRA